MNSLFNAMNGCRIKEKKNPETFIAQENCEKKKQERNRNKKKKNRNKKTYRNKTVKHSY